MHQDPCDCTHLTEERVREIAEEVALSVVRQVRLAGFCYDYKRNHEYMVYYDERTFYGSACRIVLSGDVEKHNEMGELVLKTVQEAAGWTDEEADDSRRDSYALG